MLDRSCSHLADAFNLDLERCRRPRIKLCDSHTAYLDLALVVELGSNNNIFCRHHSFIRKHKFNLQARRFLIEIEGELLYFLNDLELCVGLPNQVEWHIDVFEDNLCLGAHAWNIKCHREGGITGQLG